MLKAFQVADYSSVWKNYSTVKGLDSYIVFRAGMALGRQRQALALIDRSPSLPVELKDLMRLHYSGTVGKNPTAILQSLQGLSSSFGSALPAADRFLTMSYVGNRMSANHIAASCAERAHSMYLGMGFMAQASTALYNVAISRLSLGQQDLFDQAIRKLEKLAKQPNNEDTKAHILRLEGYSAIFNGDYRAALVMFQSLCEYYRSRPGSASFGSCLATYYYLAFKNKSFDVLLDADHTYGKYMPLLLSDFSKVISACKNLYLLPLNASILQSLASPTQYAFYLDLATDLAMEVGDFSYLKKVSEINLQHHRTFQIHFNETEMLPKLAFALHREGQDVDAKKYAADFMSAIDEKKSPLKFKKYRNILDGILKRRSRQAPSLIVELNFRKRTLTYGNKKIDFPCKGYLRSLIEALAKPEVSNTVEDVARFVYGRNSSSDRSKIVALLHRLKPTLPKSDLICIEEDRVEFNSAYKWRITLSQSLGKLERQEIIFNTLKKSNASLKMSDLERRTFLPRRTLQMDLKSLVDQGAVKKTGKGRGVCYKIQA